MSQNPYQANVGQGGPTHRTPQGNVGAIKAPGIALLVVGILDVLHGLFSIVRSLLFPQQVAAADIADAPPEMAEFVNFMNESGPLVGIGFGVFEIILAGVMILGAIKFMQLKSYGLAMTATIIAMIPCTGVMDCCIVEVGIGIWALVILLQATTKPMFR
jgi:hypothetical protein